MQGNFVAISVVLLAAGIVAFGLGLFLAHRRVERARENGRRLLAEARRDGENLKKEILVGAHEKVLQLEEDADRRDRELEEREAQVEGRSRELESSAAALRSRTAEIDRSRAETDRLRGAAETAASQARDLEQQARKQLEQIAGLTAEQARGELIAEIEADAHKEASRIARKIEDEARQTAERESRNLIVQATQRVNIRDVMESTVTFIELPSDEMKGRIIGKEGRNIRALEMATGIDLIVDDTPRSIWISSFDPVRREIARLAIDRLLVDGRIHPARIEEVVTQVGEEIETLVSEKGVEAAYTLGITDLHPKLAHLVGKMRYHTSRGQNLLQHALEVAMIAAHMCQELGARPEIALRAGLLHELGQVADETASHPLLAAADLCLKYRESEDVVQAIRSLHPDTQPRTVEALLLSTANKLSDNRPGARKDNLAIFIERLRRLEVVAEGFAGVRQAYAIKAGKELRVIVDIERTRDDNVQRLSKQIARALEREVSFPGQIKVNVVRETRAVRFAV